MGYARRGEKLRQRLLRATKKKIRFGQNGEHPCLRTEVAATKKCQEREITLLSREPYLLATKKGSQPPCC